MPPYSTVDCHSFFESDVNSEEDLKEELPGWQIANLTHLLRITSITISEKVKKSGGGGYLDLRNKFNDLLEIVENMP